MQKGGYPQSSIFVWGLQLVGVFYVTHTMGWGVFKKKVFEKFGWHSKNDLPLVGGWVINYYYFYSFTCS